MEQSIPNASPIQVGDVLPLPLCSVGSGAISIAQAMLIAGVFEFLGAILLGSGVTDTVMKKIAA